MWQRFRLMNAAILCQRQWIREGTALTGRGGVAVWCFFFVHVFDMASERAERAFTCAFGSVHAVFGARLRKTVLTKYSSG